MLEGFEPAGAPKLRPAAGPITLRQLLTHTSGFVYDMWNPMMKRWFEQTGFSRTDIYNDPAKCPPLGFDPGAKWEYGFSIDWAGKALEAATGETLNDYLLANILQPLGMAETGYVMPDSLRGRQAGVHQRQPDGTIVAAPYEHPQGADPASFTGGGGMFGAPRDYARFMRMILNRGELDGVRVLKPETVEQMTRNNIGHTPVTGLPTAAPHLTFAFDFFPGVEKRWGLSYMINMSDLKGGRKAGSLAWAGLRNTYFWIDPASGLGAAFFTQMLPFADPKTLGVLEAFEAKLYASI